MQQSINHPTPEPPTATEPATTPRLRTVTGNRFPRKCACGRGLGIPRDPDIRYVVPIGSAKAARTTSVNIHGITPQSAALTYLAPKLLGETVKPAMPVRVLP
jgi:hypothetical protein